MTIMKRIASMAALVLLSVCGGCLGDGSAAGTGGSAGGAAGTGGSAGGASGAGGGGLGGSSCACADPLAVDLTGDGATLHLMSGDYSGGGHDNLSFANIAKPASDIATVSACMADGRPWAESTTGGGSQVYWIQACAGPGAAPPCVWLNGNAVHPISLGSVYVDRSGKTIRGYVDMLQSSFQSFATPLSQTIEGTFHLVLEDGRTLTATFSVCLLASVSVG
jgi:hypothetical protein